MHVWHLRTGTHAVLCAWPFTFKGSLVAGGTIDLKHLKAPHHRLHFPFMCVTAHGQVPGVQQRSSPNKGAPSRPHVHKPTHQNKCRKLNCNLAATADLIWRHLCQRRSILSFFFFLKIKLKDEREAERGFMWFWGSGYILFNSHPPSLSPICPTSAVTPTHRTKISCSVANCHQTQRFFLTVSHTHE